ncbi:pentatricopeptide repeat-containing protein At5g15340, mitochondrial [Cornus florida]|uniref:pentatricopeptide repeat-containing protein At5g15340, mitochondrial n=1 Tax=Cornus florida TaxID=4283 RepID=UPI002897D1E4|nr:pentatricopeptide repeat-containing protein At5g15340, mitochondrial [Cornus florida]
MIWPIECTITSLARHYRSLLRTCARHSALDVGEKLHAATITTGLLVPPNSFLHNAILHLYSVCDRVWSARKVFDEIPYSHKDTVDWTILMGCYTRNGLPMEALSLFVDMQKQCVVSDEVTFVCVFNACAKLSDNVFGVQAQVCMIKMGLCSGVKACNAVMDMYVKCGLLTDTRRVFEEMRERSVVTWTVLLEGVIKEEGLESGRLFFDEMTERNEVAWTMMIVGYVGSGFTMEAFSLLREMVFGLGLGLNYVTLCSFLSACTQSGDLVMGRWVHVYALKMMVNEMDIMVGTALLDMYAKCGRINAAFQVFKTVTSRNVVAWNAMLSGLAMHGQGNVVVDIFHQMVKEVEPDDVTFTAVLSACSHSGLVEQGRHYFYNLKSVYGLTPSMEHYACMVDLLGRAGHLEEAAILIRQMPILPNEVVLGSLIGSCSVHRKLQLGEHLLQELVELHPLNTEYHILLSNMYALAGKQDKANSLRRVLIERGIRKVPGMSSIHVGGRTHQFSAGDKSHPQTQEIYFMLDEMIRRLRLAGYVPNTSAQILSGCDSVEDNADDWEEKEQALFSHSEKLAVCFGLISTRAGAPLYIFKNIRICQDCHSAMKIVSAIYDREILIRDRNRFHSFKQGSCSCCDYW